MKFGVAVPCLKYEDANAALDFFTRVFGFEERGRYVDSAGVVRQAEVFVGDGEVWLSGHGPGFWEKRGHRPDEWIVVFVDDLDALHARVRAAGIDCAPPADQSWGVRNFHVKDPEGYGWSFLRRLPSGYQQLKPLDDGGLREILTPRR